MRKLVVITCWLALMNQLLTVSLSSQDVIQLLPPQQRLEIAGPVIGWNLTVEPLYRAGYSRSELIQRGIGTSQKAVHYSKLENLWGYLNGPKGWTAAGLRFAYPSSDPRLSFRFAYPEQMAEFCGLPAAGCAEGSQDSCTVTLSVDNFVAGGNHLFQLAVLNHELGHCFGLDHSVTGLMRPGFDFGPADLDPSADEAYPSPQLIDWLRQQLSRGNITLSAGFLFIR